MTKNSRSEILINLAAIACLVACIGDFVTLFVFGAKYPGYSQLKDTMSSLGASISPVSAEISLWWAIMGGFFILFGIGFRTAFSGVGRYATIAAWLIILYGIGEGFGSGLFKADRFVTGLSVSAIIHDLLGGIGVLAIIFLPRVMNKIINKAEMPAFYHLSNFVFGISTVFLLLFLCRYLPNQDNVFAEYKGLWQRLFVLAIYIYLVTLAVLIIYREPFLTIDRKEGS